MIFKDFRKSQSLTKSQSKVFLFNKVSPRDGIRRSPQSAYVQLIEKFGVKSSIHGVNRICCNTSDKKARLLWCFVLLLALLMLIYVSLIIAARYQRKQLQTVVDTTKYPVYKIPFPEFTVCNQNRLNWSRFPQAFKLFLNKAHHTVEYETMFSDVLARYDRLSYGHFDLFANLSQHTIELLNYVNFTKVVEFMAWRCEEMLTHCYWQHIKYNCCDIFFPRKSQLGACLAFNSVESEAAKRMQRNDDKWPWRVGQYGPYSGLTVKVLLQEHLQYAKVKNKKGVVFMLGEPGVWYNFPIIVAAYTKVSISINSNVNIYDNNTRTLSPLDRGCIFKDEQNIKIYKTLEEHEYMFENCKSACQQNTLLKLCNCSTDLFFPVGTYPVCKLLDMPCLTKNNVGLLEFERSDERNFVHAKIPGIKCDCLLNCMSLKYMPDVRSTILTEQFDATNDSFVDMDLYLRRSYTLAYRTTMIFTWVDLLVSFGGVAGLFLGCSLISVAELLYFFLIDTPKLLWQQHKIGQGQILTVKQNFKY